MRIVSGIHKGKRFSPPSSFKARPTTDYAKESLFNVLLNRIDFEEIRVLDLFSGTGSISYEFASRGTKSIVSVEIAGNHYAFIRKCIADLGFEKVINAIKGDSFKFIAKTSETFDLIFADAPFDLKEADELPDLIFGTKILAQDGVFIMEHSDKKSFISHPNFLELRDYGKVNFTFFGHKPL